VLIIASEGDSNQSFLRNLFEDKTPDFVASARFWRSSRGITEGVLEDLPERVSVSLMRRRQDVANACSTSRNHRLSAGGRSLSVNLRITKYHFCRSGIFSN